MVPKAIERRLTANDVDVAAASRELAGRRLPIFVGSEAHRATALVGAAKIQELCNEPTMAVNAEDYLHLTGFAVGREQAVIVPRKRPSSVSCRPPTTPRGKARPSSWLQTPE